MSVQDVATIDEDRVVIGRARLEDLPRVVEIDAEISGQPKADFWYAFYSRQGSDPRRAFLVARSGEEIVGYIIGAIRVWEFGSPPCGWVYAIGVDPAHRKRNVGTRLFTEVVKFFNDSDVKTIRTMLHIDDHMLISFFRMQGMAAGPFIELEMITE